MLKFTALFCIFTAIMAGKDRLSDSDFDWSMFLRFDVKNKMIEHKITPTAVPVPPEGTCHVHFHWGEPEPGQVVPEDLDKVARPTVTWSAKNESLYLMMSYCVLNWFDVRDAPEQGRNYTLNEWTEWIIYNVHKQKIYEGSDLYDYQPCPVPKNNTVKHLVIYLIFKQNGTIHIPRPTEINWEEFHARQTIAGFIKTYNLGTPIAANFYYIRYDKQRRKDTFKDSVADWEKVLSYENLETKEVEKT
ncbi:uncharacterized protein LOC135845795 [Planococcus citri]|uniref:uncharacterized protein LOC135845795 n=1 Tax=Planococcus citri TaxID=170843 RepID=UPI0031F98D07